MSKKLLSTILVIGGIALLVVWMIGRYNTMVVEQENVENAWGQVENQYQRRNDLIPQLVGSVEGYMIHESQTLTDVINARAKATQVTIDPSNMSDAQLKAFQQTQGELSSALSRLMVSIERYPELKADSHVSKLMADIEGTENRIAVARNAFNDAAKTYNTYIRKFPNNIIASMFSFERKPYFEAEEGAKTAPKVDFSGLKHKTE